MASFEEKVEALRRLREKRLIREESKQECTESAVPACGGSGYAESTCRSGGAKNSDTDELPAVLEHYAGLQENTSELAIAPDHSDDGEKGSTDEADALYCLGHCYEQGLHDCDCDMEQAVKYYRQAAEKGSVVGQWRLGHLYEYGNGLDADDALAACWYRKAASAGHSHAQSSLALLLEDGRADAIEENEALRWHLEAAEQGNALSQYCAARSLVASPAASQDDKDHARVLLKKSASSGFPLAVETLEKGSLHGDEDHIDRIIDSDDEVSTDAASCSLLELAARVAKQIEHLPDSEADTFLESLLASLDETTAFDSEAVEDC